MFPFWRLNGRCGRSERRWRFRSYRTLHINMRQWNFSADQWLLEVFWLLFQGSETTGFYRMRVCAVTSYDFARFYPVLPDSTQFYTVLLDSTQLYLILPYSTRFYLILLDSTQFYLILLNSTQFYPILPDSTWFYSLWDVSTSSGSTWFYSILPDSTRFYTVLLDSAWFYPILLDSTRVYSLCNVSISTGATLFYSILPHSSWFYSLLLDSTQLDLLWCVSTMKKDLVLDFWHLLCWCSSDTTTWRVIGIDTGWWSRLCVIAW